MPSPSEDEGGLWPTSANRRVAASPSSCGNASSEASCSPEQSSLRSGSWPRATRPLGTPPGRRSAISPTRAWWTFSMGEDPLSASGHRCCGWAPVTLGSSVKRPGYPPTGQRSPGRDGRRRSTARQSSACARRPRSLSVLASGPTPSPWSAERTGTSPTETRFRSASPSSPGRSLPGPCSPARPTWDRAASTPGWRSSATGSPAAVRRSLPGCRHPKRLAVLPSRPASRSSRSCTRASTRRADPSR